MFSCLNFLTHVYYLKRRMLTLITFFINTRSKWEGILNLAGLNHARMLVLYLLDNPLSEQRAPQVFKDRFLHLLGDISLFLATAIHPHFRMPAVLYLNRTLAGTMKSTLISEMKSLMEANSQSSESNNDDDNKQDFFEVQLVFRRMNNPVKQFQFHIKNIALSDFLSCNFVANLSIVGSFLF